MSDHDPNATTADDSSGETSGETAGERAGAVATAEPEARTTHDEHGAAAPSLLDRYVVPFVVPIVVIGAVIFYILNVSRVFLATSGTGAVVAASVLTVLILAGAAIISASPEMHGTSLVLVVIGFLAVVLLAGSLTLGEAEGEGAQTEEAAGPLPAEGPFLTELEIHSFNIGFTPDGLETETGISKLTMINDQNGPHTFVFDDPSIAWNKLEVVNQGDAPSGRFFIGVPGDYTYFCDIPGHRAAGMEGVLTVSGEEKTFAAALEEVGDTGGASASTAS